MGELFRVLARVPVDTEPPRCYKVCSIRAPVVELADT